MYDSLQEMIEIAPRTEVKPSTQKIKPIYKLGAADPIAYVRDKSNDEKNKAKVLYNFMSGCDTKIYVDDEPLNVAQAINTQQDRAVGLHTGTLIVIGSPGMKENKEFLAKNECHLLVKAADEYGNIEIMFDERVRIDGHSWGVSADDIVTETLIRFTVLN